MSDTIQQPIVNISIDAEAINRTVAQAILESALGKRVREIVDQQVLKGYAIYQDAFQNAVSQLVRDEITRILAQEYGEAIKKAVREKMTQTTADEIVSKMWERLTRDLTYR